MPRAIAKPLVRPSTLLTISIAPLLAGERHHERRDGRDLPIIRSVEQSTGTESKFSQLELALSHRYAAEKGEAIFLDKATTDNTIARREHLGEPSLPHTEMATARRNDELCVRLGLMGPHSHWLKALPPDSGERFLFDYYRHHFMEPEECEAADAELLAEVGEEVEEAEVAAAEEQQREEEVAAAAEMEAMGVEVLDLRRGRLASAVDLEMVSFRYEKPSKLSRSEKLSRSQEVKQSRAELVHAMGEERRRSLLRECGCDMDACDEKMLQRIYAWHPASRSIPKEVVPDDGRTRYCIYGGPCYTAKGAALSSSGVLRQPRVHKPECELEIARLFYEKVHGAPKGRKRARDGEG